MASVSRESIAKVQDSVNTAAQRRSLGIYYTPQLLADVLTDWAIRSRDDVVLEPSFGGCALLDSALRRFQQLGHRTPASSLTGFDIDEQAFSHLDNLLGKRPPTFRKLDFLQARPESRAIDVVVANPPFVGYRQLSSSQLKSVQRWRRDFESGLSANASLWAYFLSHSLNFLKEEGRIAFVLPAAFQSADYATVLREKLRRLFREVRVLNVARPLFSSEGAAARVCILLAAGYRPEGHVRSADLVEGDVEVLTEAGFWHFTNGEHTAVESTKEKSRRLLAELADQGLVSTVGDFAHPLIGEVTGDTAFFVKGLDEWADLGVTIKDLVPVYSRGSQLPKLVCRDSSNSKWLLKPRIPLRKQVSTYLEAYSEKRRASNATFAKRTPWWNVSYEPNALGFVSSLHHDSFRIVASDFPTSCTNVLYKLVPRDGPTHSGMAIALASLSSFAQLGAELLSRTLGGGALKLEPSDVRRLALPRCILELGASHLAELLSRVEIATAEGGFSAATAEVDATLVELSGLRSDDAVSLVRAIRRLRTARQ
jgi:hypothetical protein